MHDQIFPSRQQALEEINTKIASLHHYANGAWSETPCAGTQAGEIIKNELDEDERPDRGADEPDAPAFEPGDRISGPGLPILAVRVDIDGVRRLVRTKPPTTIH